jgi:hypothetical protein
MADLILTKEEEQQILQHRAETDRRRWIIVGMDVAANHLRSLGRQSAGGDGEATNPTTGRPWGDSWFVAADAVTKQAAYLAANPGFKI